MVIDGSCELDLLCTVEFVPGVKHTLHEKGLRMCFQENCRLVHYVQDGQDYMLTEYLCKSLPSSHILKIFWRWFHMETATTMAAGGFTRFPTYFPEIAIFSDLDAKRFQGWDQLRATFFGSWDLLGGDGDMPQDATSLGTTTVTLRSLNESQWVSSAWRMGPATRVISFPSGNRESTACRGNSIRATCNHD